MESAQPLQQKERLFIIDAIRGVALCGILILNMPFFGLPFDCIFNLDIYQETSTPNVATWYLTSFLVEGSFRSLFSMLFGVGMILITNRLEVKLGIRAADIYYRRLIWLLIFGVINAYVFLWAGDILYHYAICGLFLFPFRKASYKLLLAFSIFFITVVAFKSELKQNERLTMREKGLAAQKIKDAKKDSLNDDQKAALNKWNQYLENAKVEGKRKKAEEQVKKMQGSYITVWEKMSPVLEKMESIIFYNDLFFDVMIFIFFGMALYKMGVLTGEKPAWLYFSFIVIGYIIGFGWGYIEGHAWRLAHYSFFDHYDHRPFVVNFYQVHRVFVTLGHIGTLILLWKSGVFNWLLKLFSNVGQMAFTNYLMQSILCTLFFNGYGLGYFAKLQRFELLYAVAAVWIFQIIFSALWLRYFLYGPFEWVWRSLTYWKLQPMKRLSNNLSAAIAEG